MEVEYESTFHYNNVVFYLTADRSRAYFLCGGCVYSIRRPVCGANEETVKFGLVLRGLGPKDRTIANYVRSELRRRTRGRVVPPGEDDVFLDSLILLHGGAPSEVDAINMGEVEVGDECLAEHITSIRTSPGVIITGARVRTSDKVIELLEQPVVINSDSQFKYTPTPCAFVLAQANIQRLPPALDRLVVGAFDGIPAPRQPIGGPDRRTDIIVTGRSSVRVLASGGAKQKKRATVSEFVQVKHIDRVGTHPTEPAPRPTLADLWLLFVAAENAVGDSQAVGYLSCSEDFARRSIGSYAQQIFGTLDAPRPFVGASMRLRPAQKLAVLYYLIHRERQHSLFPMLLRITRGYVQHYGVALPPVDDEALADALNCVLRDALAAGVAAEHLLHAPPRCVVDPWVAGELQADSLALLRLASTITSEGQSPAASHPDRVRALGAFMGILYTGGSRLTAAIHTARLSGVTSIVIAASAANKTSAFDRGPAGTAARTRGAAYLAALLSSRLTHAAKQTAASSGAVGGTQT
ncbi:tegument protein UL21 [Bovine alphaherpesvirus 2]|uniref:Tegument protein UL21 n=1 Tax=Bovine alphaherpesvirus 2 TaxID=10295 RepID=A0ABX6WLR8_9ALPH|nr:tegument protein UL21 [Bovine alphaherpesvirus 2]QPO25154.1 tegument protein UL21 [Bovine alphaherpesvirus 2]